MYLWVFAILLAFVLPLRAEEHPPQLLDNASQHDAGVDDEAIAAEDVDIVDIDEDNTYETIVISGRPPAPGLPQHRAGSQVTRKDIEYRLPRSTPDALRYEPGVFVQQTAHSQGSAFIRGLTGQQTLILFDGIRLNNSTYRQGPNQYFFTLDSQAIQSIQIVRGGASTRFGSDALGGVILALPIEPLLAPAHETDLATWDPHLLLRTATADREKGGRIQTNLTLGKSFAFFGGMGGRTMGLLQSSGPISSPDGSGPPLVPRMAEDGRTQLGTGFDELTADGSLVYQLNPRHRLKLAAHAYRQYDAPRTDQCPAAYAPHDECLKYDEQFRTLVYGAWEAEPKMALLHSLRMTLSWQNQHERRTLDRPASFVENIGRDDVNTFGVTLTAKTSTARIAPQLELVLNYGADTYHDRVTSLSWIRFTDITFTQQQGRGQYVDGSHYTYGGAFLEAQALLWRFLTWRAGGRFSWFSAHAPSVPQAGSEAVNKNWTPLVGNTGLEVRVSDQLQLHLNADRSLRTPNLDDMTSRQQTGPGFQFENPDLAPEIAHTLEIGVRMSELGPLTLALWAFNTTLHGAVVKRPMAITDCPPNTPQCETSWNRFQLANADDASRIRGLEAYLKVDLSDNLVARLTAAWTHGEGPNLGDPPSDPAIPFEDKVPLSRIPPFNGTAEILWHHPTGLSVGAALRFAATQDRLALADISDERIPRGGTPGFAVLDLRLNYRIDDLFFASIALENAFDAPYRYHGSSVNGPARGLTALIDLGPLWRL
ncbi:MAG: TonB-dependent receptor [Myxococcota bacterium]|nr:TonB-dependent receptor [Myxococcota bacterium]